MKTGIFYAVGVGTEPLDLTLRAKQVLETAEVLVTPITRAGEPSAAARIAEQVVSFSGKEIIPLLFPMQKHLDYRERLRGELLAACTRLPASWETGGNGNTGRCFDL